MILMWALLILCPLALAVSFDTRKEFPLCVNDRGIMDQGECGSCYSMAATAVIGARTCIDSLYRHTHLRSHDQPSSSFTSAEAFQSSQWWDKTVLSPQRFLSCSDKGGCQGGYIEQVYDAGAALCFPTCNRALHDSSDVACTDGCMPYSNLTMQCGSLAGQTLLKHACAPCLAQCSFTAATGAPLPRSHASIAIGDCLRTTGSRPLTSDLIEQLEQHEGEGEEDVIREAKLIFEYDGLLEKSIIQHGPLAASFDVCEDFFSFFKSNPNGIFESCDQCNENATSHAVVIVGFADQPIPHWILSNSWGRRWPFAPTSPEAIAGKGGYFRLKRGISCGIGSKHHRPVYEPVLTSSLPAGHEPSHSASSVSALTSDGSHLARTRHVRKKAGGKRQFSLIGRAAKKLLSLLEEELVRRGVEGEVILKHITARAMSGRLFEIAAVLKQVPVKAKSAATTTTTTTTTTSFFTTTTTSITTSSAGGATEIKHVHSNPAGKNDIAAIDWSVRPWKDFLGPTSAPLPSVLPTPATSTANNDQTHKLIRIRAEVMHSIYDDWFVRRLELI